MPDTTANLPLKAHLMQPFLNAFERIGTISKAARSVGLNRDTVLEWREKYPEFNARFEQSKLALVEKLEDNVMRMADNGDLGANIFLLKNMAPDKYTERYKHDIESVQIERLIAAFNGVLKRTLDPAVWERVSDALEAAAAEQMAAPIPLMVAGG